MAQFLANMQHHYIIADHMRAALFLIADGVKPSGKQQGYVLRRLIRRSLSSALALGIDIANGQFFQELIDSVLDSYADAYPELVESKELALILITTESNKYNKAISRGEKEWEKVFNKIDNLKGDEAAQLTFDLYQTHGVPLELSQDILKTKGVVLEYNILEALLHEHQNKSQSDSTSQFKGGLAEHNEYTTKLHTATHILHHNLREMFGNDVKQMGSAIKSDKARFDFSFSRRLEEDEMNILTQKIQHVIDLGLKVEKKEMPTDQARELGAIGLFGEKYGERVTVYTILDDKGNVYSREFCGGPHVANTEEIGTFEIIKQKSVGQGVKRIEFKLL